MKYLPFLHGPYSVAPGLVPVARQEHAWDRRLFQIDAEYDRFLANKQQCRLENIKKYYLESAFHADTRRMVNDHLLRQLLAEYPERFDLSVIHNRTALRNLHTGEIISWNHSGMELTGSPYDSLFDALCSQVQEDIAVVQLTATGDWLAAIHLCAPNHWSPAEKIGRPFDSIHRPVPGMEKTMQHYRKMLESIIHKGPFTRFAWGVATDNRLNHHPEPPPGTDAATWQGRSAARDGQLFIRTEKQNTIGLPSVSAFLFTIRTYFYAVETLSAGEKTALHAAVCSMSPEALQYKGMNGLQELLTESLAGN